MQHSNLDVHRCRAVKGWKIAGILAVAFNPNDTKVAVAKENGHIDVLHFPSLSHSLVRVYFCSNLVRQTIIIKNDDHRLEPKHEKQNHSNPYHIRSVVWKDETTFLTAGLDGVVRLWHASSGSMLDSFSSGGGPIWNMALHPGVKLFLLSLLSFHFFCFS